MLEVVNRKLLRKHWKTTSRASGIKSGSCVPVMWGKVSTAWWNSFFPMSLASEFGWLPHGDINIRAGEVPEGRHL